MYPCRSASIMRFCECPTCDRASPLCKRHRFSCFSVQAPTETAPNPAWHKTTLASDFALFLPALSTILGSVHLRHPATMSCEPALLRFLILLRVDNWNAIQNPSQMNPCFPKINCTLGFSIYNIRWIRWFDQSYFVRFNRQDIHLTWTRHCQWNIRLFDWEARSTLRCSFTHGNDVCSMQVLDFLLVNMQACISHVSNWWVA